jgi:hypothetical protein
MAPERLGAPAALALVRFALVGLLLGGAALAWQDAVIRWALPIFSAWVDAIDDTFRTVELAVLSENGETVIRRIATPARTHSIGGRVIYADPQTQISTQVGAGMVLQPIVLAGALLAAWPWRRWRELALRLAFALPLVALVVMLDVPTTLYGMIWYEEVNAADPQWFSPLIYWPDFMNAGGRFALTFAAVAAAIGLARRRDTI